MKNFGYLCALFLAFQTPAIKADSFLNALKGAQDSEAPAPVHQTPDPSNVPRIGSSTSSASTTTCDSSDQTSLPLSYLVGLMRYQGQKIEPSYNPNNGKVTLNFGEMASNCYEMLRFELKKPTDSHDYLVEAKFKTCGSSECEYPVLVKKDGLIKTEKKAFSPNFEGFRNCLKETGVFADNGVDKTKMAYNRQSVTLSGAYESGSLNFVSKGPSSPIAYQEVQTIGCSLVEQITPDPYSILTKEDRLRQNLDREAAKVCETNNYAEIARFIEEYNQYEGTLGDIRNRLILKDLEALAKKIRAGKQLNKLEYDVLKDFKDYIVEPLVDKVSELYYEIESLPNGANRDAKVAEYEKAIKLLKSYGKKPYLEMKDITQLENVGLIDEAKTAQNALLSIQVFKDLGVNESGTTISPRVAARNYAKGVAQYDEVYKDLKHEFDVKNGRIRGLSTKYAELAQHHRKNIETRSRNFNQMIQEEAMLLTGQDPYCYATFRNTQRCLQEAQLNIQDWQAELEEFNQMDLRIAQELEAKSEQYAQWEKQARSIEQDDEDEEDRRVASDDSRAQAPQTSSPPTAPQASTRSYEFNMPQSQGNQQGAVTNNSQAQQQQLLMMQMMQQYQQQQRQPQNQSPYQQNYNPYTQYSWQGRTQYQAPQLQFQYPQFQFQQTQYPMNTYNPNYQYNYFQPSGFSLNANYNLFAGQQFNSFPQGQSNQSIRGYQFSI